jgi:hypothetical protein
MFIPEVSPIQPVNVIVQQAPGLPAWITVMLSALTGAASAILSGIAIEFLKPYMDRRRMLKMIKDQLNAEFLANLSQLKAAKRIIFDASSRTESDKSLAQGGLNEILREVKQDRYDLYFENDKSIVYEIDKNQNLSAFYSVLNRKPSNVVSVPYFFEALGWIEWVVSVGQHYLDASHLEERTNSNAQEYIYEQLRLAEERGRERGREQGSRNDGV